jgi:hypothetical protein
MLFVVIYLVKCVVFVGIWFVACSLERKKAHEIQFRVDKTHEMQFSLVQIL